MKKNNYLKIGLITFICFVIIEIIGDTFFEIRSKALYDFVIYSENIILLLTFVILMIGLYKFSKSWKWFIIVPLLFLVIFIIIFSIIFNKMPNEITIKEDTEVLYVNKNNPCKKIIRQAYFTGWTGDHYHSDTIRVYELFPSLRIIQGMELKNIDSGWIKILMTK